MFARMRGERGGGSEEAALELVDISCNVRDDNECIHNAFSSHTQVNRVERGVRLCLHDDHDDDDDDDGALLHGITPWHIHSITIKPQTNKTCVVHMLFFD